MFDRIMNYMNKETPFEHAKPCSVNLSFTPGEIKILTSSDDDLNDHHVVNLSSTETDDPLNILYGNKKEESQSEDEGLSNTEDFDREAEFEQLRTKIHLMQVYLDENYAASDSYSLASQIVIGMSRDFMWGTATNSFLNPFGTTFNAFWGTTLAQMGITLPMVIATANLSNSFSKSQLFLNNKSAWVNKNYVYAFASWSSIPVWNVFQYLGNMVGEAYGLKASAAGYVSGIFTGVAETVWQNFLIIPLLMQQPSGFLEPALNSLGGAVWQWIYQANLDARNQTVPVNTTNSTQNFTNEDLGVGAEIAIGVACSTFLMSMLARTIQSCKKTHEENDSQFADDENSVNSFVTSDNESSEMGIYNSRRRIYGSNRDVMFQNPSREVLNELSAGLRNRK